MYATVVDLQRMWRPFTADELGQVQAVLDAAGRLVKARVPDVDVRIADGRLDPLLVADVVCEVARRALSTRVTGVEQSTTTVGQVSTSATYANPQSNLYLTRDELLRLLPAAQRRAFSISTFPAV